MLMRANNQCCVVKIELFVFKREQQYFLLLLALLGCGFCFCLSYVQHINLVLVNFGNNHITTQQVFGQEKGLESQYIYFDSKNFANF